MPRVAAVANAALEPRYGCPRRSGMTPFMPPPPCCDRAAIPLAGKHDAEVDRAAVGARSIGAIDAVDRRTTPAASRLAGTQSRLGQRHRRNRLADGARRNGRSELRGSAVGLGDHLAGRESATSPPPAEWRALPIAHRVEQSAARCRRDSHGQGGHRRTEAKHVGLSNGEVAGLQQDSTIRRGSDRGQTQSDPLR